MIYPSDKYPVDETFPPFLYCEHMMLFLEKLKQAGNEIAYISIQEPRVAGSHDQNPSGRTNTSLLLVWSGIVVRAGATQQIIKATQVALHRIIPIWKLLMVKFGIIRL